MSFNSRIPPLSPNTFYYQGTTDEDLPFFNEIQTVDDPTIGTELYPIVERDVLLEMPLVGTNFSDDEDAFFDETFFPKSTSLNKPVQNTNNALHTASFPRSVTSTSESVQNTNTLLPTSSNQPSVVLPPLPPTPVVQLFNILETAIWRPSNFSAVRPPNPIEAQLEKTHSTHADFSTNAILTTFSTQPLRWTISRVYLKSIKDESFQGSLRCFSDCPDSSKISISTLQLSTCITKRKNNFNRT